jgi:hypothetical protein
MDVDGRGQAASHRFASGVAPQAPSPALPPSHLLPVLGERHDLLSVMVKVPKGIKHVRAAGEVCRRRREETQRGFRREGYRKGRQAREARNPRLRNPHPLSNGLSALTRTLPLPHTSS